MINVQIKFYYRQEPHSLYIFFFIIINSPVWQRSMIATRHPSYDRLSAENSILAGI